MPSDSTVNMGTVIRTRLLTFVPKSGGTLLSKLGGGTLDTARLWRDAPPDTASYPFAVMRLINRVTRREYNFEKEPLDVEIMFYGRPRAQAQLIEDCADVADQAMLRWREPIGGLFYSRERSRDTLPPPVEPADREVVQVRCVYSLAVWPTYLTQYSTP